MHAGLECWCKAFCSPSPLESSPQGEHVALCSSSGHQRAICTTDAPVKSRCTFDPASMLMTRRDNHHDSWTVCQVCLCWGAFCREPKARLGCLQIRCSSASCCTGEAWHHLRGINSQAPAASTETGKEPNERSQVSIQREGQPSFSHLQQVVLNGLNNSPRV